MFRVCTRVLATSATIAVAAFAAATTALAAYPVNWNVVTAFAGGVWLPDAAPAGANNWQCKPSREHPYPVVLIHGTFENENDNWQALAPTLANAGYCVYAVTYGQTWYSGGLGGVADIYASAGQVASFVASVLASTGAAQVDLVGHSQGGLLPRLYLKDRGGFTYVHQVVSLAPDNGPPSLSGLEQIADWIPGATALVAFSCPACGEQLSPAFYSSLNSGPETDPGIQYTVIASTHDELVTPSPEQAFLPPGPNVVNETVQSICPDDNVGHVGLPYDPDAVQMVLDALDPSLHQPVTCSQGFEL